METIGELTIRPRMHSEPAETISGPYAVARDDDSDGQHQLVTDVEQTSSEMGNATSTASTDADATVPVNCDEAEAELQTTVSSSVDRGETMITIKPAIGDSSNAN